MITIDGNLYAPVHDPKFAEIERIMNFVGVKFIQVVAYSTEFLPYGTTPQTAACVTRKHRYLININSSKQFMISVERLTDPYSVEVGNHFDLYAPDFFWKLARYLRKAKAISALKYWLIRLKLWWNK